EYSPSLAHLDKKGCLQTRYVPEGLPLQSSAAKATVKDTIPAIYQLRKANRGFEALALSPSGRYLFIGLQSPLMNPTATAGNASLNTRILRFDLRTGSFDREYVYRFQDPAEFPRDNLNPLQTARPQDMKVSAMVALDDDTLLVDERVDVMAKVFLVDVRGATNILGTWDCTSAATTAPFNGNVQVPMCPPTPGSVALKSIEQMTADDLTLNGIDAISSPARKSLVVTIDSRAGMPQKIEGIAVVHTQQLSLA